MTHRKPGLWLLITGVAALVFGLKVPDPNLAGVPSPYPHDRTLLAANESQGSGQTKVQPDNNADESAKMGKDSGTHTGDKTARPENVTKKVDQKPRQNPITGD